MANWLPAHLTRAQLEERRLAALEWIDRGTHPNKDIADHFGVSVHTVYSWKARFKDKGTLQASVAQGPRTRLTNEQHAQLSTLLREGPVQHGFPNDTWTTRRVRDLIGHRFGVWYHADHVRKVLHHLGFTPQMPDGRAAERNELRRANWKEASAPELGKKVAQGATVVY